MGAPSFWLEVLFGASLLLIPWVFHPATSHSIVAKDFLALWFSLAFLFLGTVEVVRGGTLGRIPLTVLVPLGLYLVYGTLRAWMSPFPAHSWAAWRITLSSFSPLLAGFVLFRREKTARRLATVAGVSVFVVCCYGLLQFVSVTVGRESWDPVRWDWGDVPFVNAMLRFLETNFRYFRWEKFEGFGRLPGVCSTLGNPNFLAGFLVPFFPVFTVLGYCLWKTKGFRGACLPWGVSLLILLSFVAAGSRGAVLGLVGMGAVAFLFAGGFLSETRGKLWFWGGVAFSVSMSAAIVSGLVFLFGVAAKPSIEKDLGSIENRAIVFRRTGMLIAENPIWGVGPGNFTIRFPEYLSGVDAEKYGWMESPEEKVLEHAHSEPLEILADLGLVGFLLWSGFLVGWFFWVWKGWNRLEASISRWILAGMVCGVAGVLFQNLISVNLRWISSAWVFWGLVGAAAGWATRSGRTVESAVFSSFPPRQVWTIPAAGLLTLLLFLPSTKRLAADWVFVQGRNAALQNRAGAEKLLRHSLDLDPANAQAWYLLGGYYFGRGEYQKAIDCYEEVQKIRGNVVVLAENMATSFVKLSTVLEKDFERKEALLKAIELYEESAVRHPSFPRLEDYLARTYQFLGFERLSQEHRRKAIRLYEKWLDWSSSYPRPQYALDLSKNYFAEGDYEKSFWLLRTAQRWKADSRSVEEMKKALFRKQPELKKLWQREERKAAQKADRKN